MKKHSALSTVAVLLLIATIVFTGFVGEAVAAPAAQSTITSAFALQNQSQSQSANYVVHFLNTDGNEVLDAMITSGVTTGYAPLPPLGLGNFPLPNALPSGWQGSVVVDSDQPVTAILNYYSPTENAVNYVFGSVNGFVSDSVGSPLYLPFILRERSGRNTSFGIQNASQSDAAVQLKYYDTTGAVRKTIDRTLKAGQSIIRHQLADDGDLGSAFMGYVVATSSAPLAGSVNDMGTNILYNYPGSAMPDDVLYMPFMVRNRSNQNTAYSILNPHQTNTNVTVTYTGSNAAGQPVSVSNSRLLPPSEMWNLGQASVDGLPDGFLGSAKVVASQPVVAIVNHTYGAFSAEGKKTTYTAVPDSAATRNASMPFALRKRSGKEQGIIIQNVDSVSTSVSITFTGSSPTGPVNVTKSKVIPANGFWNFGTSWAEFADLTDGFYGTATVSSSAGRIVAIVNTWNDAIGPDSLGTYTAINYTPAP